VIDYVAQRDPAVVITVPPACNDHPAV